MYVKEWWKRLTPISMLMQTVNAGKKYEGGREEKKKTETSFDALFQMLHK